MKRIAVILAAAGAAAALSAPASAHPVCVYLDTPYPVACVPLPI